jgi:hypothetical protein
MSSSIGSSHLRKERILLEMIDFCVGKDDRTLEYEVLFIKGFVQFDFSREWSSIL